jgi:transcriptional regulator
MYVPTHFRQDDPAKLHALIEAMPFATLVTVEEGRPVASHVPILLDADRGAKGTLVCHVARANPQWRAITPQTVALAIFLGPDAYVSPNWYASKREHGRVVPTWNYVAVHVWGPVRLVEDPSELRALVTHLTRRHEANLPNPWTVEDAPESYVRDQLRGIVGLEIAIERMKGKWKLSQNRPRNDIEGAIDGLESSGSPADRATAAAMRSSLDEGRRDV